MTAISRKMVQGAAVLATVLALGGVAQGADSNDRIVPPNPAEVAILRGLLALQHPSLRTGGTPAAVVPAAVTPTASTEQGQPSGQTTVAAPGNDA